jgi:hypothetical protein
VPARAGTPVVLPEPEFGKASVQALADDLPAVQSYFVDARWRTVPDSIPPAVYQNTRNRGIVWSASLHHFNVIWPGAMTIAVNGRPSLWIWTDASDIKVFPVPHSAITAALRSVSHFFATPIAATA